ncbi:VOC family protein [Georgenia deserti]|uniref:VOC family protein n=1 Tax=Georgenia deserti TaxID=2093781 RepID=A0ABW4KYL2_9MICO
MFTSIAITPMYVTDQDEALRFYTETLGFTVDTDVDLGTMRWLTVALPGDPERQVLLQRIGDQTATGSAETAAMLRELTERGTTSWMILNTDDCRAAHAELTRRGAEIIQEPEEHPYGVDMAVRDPFGNQIRITQRNDWRP